jgi:hypothetical protein
LFKSLAENPSGLLLRHRQSNLVFEEAQGEFEVI